MGCGTSFVKYVLFIFNLVFALVGLAMIGLGVAARLNWVVVMEKLPNNFKVGPWLFIVVGAIVFVIAFFGCCGAIRESHCMIVTYAIFLLVLIIVQVAIAVFLFVKTDTFESSIKEMVNNLFIDAKTDEGAKRAFIEIETQFGCCGDTGAGDYPIGGVPASCCAKNGVVYSSGGPCTAFNAERGCRDILVEGYQKWSKVIGGVAIGIACTEVLGALFALCLANSIRNMDRRSRY